MTAAKHLETEAEEPILVETEKPLPELAVPPETDRDADDSIAGEVISPARPTAMQVATQMLQGIRFLGMPLVWLIGLAFCGGTGVSAILWLTTLPPLPNCQQLNLLSTDNEKLYCAEQAARSGKAETMVAGLQLIKHWTADHPLHSRSKLLMRDWSKSVMAAAYHRAVQEEDLPGAITLAKGIPLMSPHYQQAQKAIVVWQKDYKRGKAFEDVIQAALKAQNWPAAEAQLDQLSKLDGDYWQQRFKRLKQQTITEQLARRQIQQVKRLSEVPPNNPAVIGQLIAVLDSISLSSYARPEAEVELTRLGKSLLALINQQLAQSNLAGAIAAAQDLPTSLPLSTEAQDILWFSQAQPLASKQVPLQPLSQIGHLWFAVPRLRQINANSALYPHAQALVQQLELQLQNLHQLQLANSAAGFGQISTFQLAIALAQTIAPKQPQRLYAQTLIAQWRKDLQLAQDRPYLVRARKLAAVGTVPSLKAAIAQAKQIALGRSLRLEAQTAIADWNLKLQALEDQAAWKQAQTLAKQKKFAEAIKAAEKIAAGRALYAEAQAAIPGWTVEKQIVEDRPILDRAAAIAKEGKLEAAITYAAQIPPGRALYEETQAAMATWQAQLEALQAASSPPEGVAPPAETDEPPAPVETE